jgi:hypothetical protein
MQFYSVPTNSSQKHQTLYRFALVITNKKRDDNDLLSQKIELTRFGVQQPTF